jgi:hypothetical protein
MTLLPACGRAGRARRLRARAFAPAAGLSWLGGCDEFEESRPACRRNAATSVRSASTSAACSATTTRSSETRPVSSAFRAASSSYDGCSGCGIPEPSHDHKADASTDAPQINRERDWLHPLGILHIRWKRIPGMLLAVILHPETERCIIDTELPRYLGNRQRVIDHLPGGLLLKLGRVSFPFSWHLFPFLSRRILFGSPVREQRGTSLPACGVYEAVMLPARNLPGTPLSTAHRGTPGRIRTRAHGSGGGCCDLANLCHLPACTRSLAPQMAKIIPRIFGIMAVRGRRPSANEC